MSSRCLGRKRGSLSHEGEGAGGPRRAEKRRSARRGQFQAPAELVVRGCQSAVPGPSGSDAAAHWEVLSRSYHRLTQAFLAQPAIPPVDELDAFSALAIRSRLSPHELVALHYATLNQLLAGDERYAAESSSAARRALVSVLLRLMGKYRRSTGVAAKSGCRCPAAPATRSGLRGSGD
jgi:hypothetical protein